ncbi:RlpA-like double-psi beta-barrel-protein domain-containing protein-containing protein [Boletus reticuloceps]|uniref:RlpA-like double-psi beta-barrel-protein domain-containing protein-containing protein n=1 Tax=Boletus reticuloceps TaxID=495285 RepID=A0A8I3A8U4_9AGAM|nr:RlpA-like double-psi beta-barrel-protein domain-containing protein-containing protein [Boletus reticuloceps]
MALRVSTFFNILILLLPFVAANHWSKRHQEVAHRARGDVDIHKRQSFTGARFTYYAVGLGACGQYNQPNDYIVALNVPQYGNGYPGPQCFKSITIQYGGKTAVATIMDECEACPYGGLDFSQGLFSYFSDLSAGVLSGTWWFNDGSGGGGGGDTTTTSWTPTTTWEAPTTTSTPDYTPPPTSSTPDYTPTTPSSSTPAYTPTTSTTWTTSSTTTTTSSSPSSSSTTSYNSNTGQTSGLAIPTGGVVPTPDTSNPQNILVINEILIEVGLMLSAEKHE